MNNLPFFTAVALVVLSGSGAAALAALSGRASRTRLVVAEMLARIALLGAAAIFALLHGPG